MAISPTSACAGRRRQSAHHLRAERGRQDDALASDQRCPVRHPETTRTATCTATRSCGWGSPVVRGQRLAVMRRKGRVNTLLSYDPTTGAELSERCRKSACATGSAGSVRGSFLAMFSLDHDALVRGGEALAQGKGRCRRKPLRSRRRSRFDPRPAFRLDARRKPCSSRARRPRPSTGRWRTTMKPGGRRRTLPVRPAEWTPARSAMETAESDYEPPGPSRRAAEGSPPTGAAGGDPPGCGRARTGAAAAGGTGRVPLLPPSAPSERVAAVTKRTPKRSEPSARPRNACSSTRLSWRRSRSTTPSSPMPKPSRRSTTPPRLPRSEHAVAKAERRSKGRRRTLISSSDKSPATKEPADPLQWIPDPTGRRDPRLDHRRRDAQGHSPGQSQDPARKKLEIDQLDAEILSLGQEACRGTWRPTSIRLPIMAIRKRGRNNSKTKRRRRKRNSIAEARE
jgi:hypothetical protein